MASLTARDVDRHMRMIGHWVNWAETCDTFKAGDPDTPIGAIAVSWMSTMAALAEAHRRSCRLFITHEPTFYSHMDDDSAFNDDACTHEKRAFLAETGMVVYRCHDVWDRQPTDGILDRWAACLDLTAEPMAEETFIRVVPIEPATAGEFAQHVARRVQQFSQPAALLVGDPDQSVAKIGIGTGAIANARSYHALGADLGVVTELIWWRDARWAKDSGFPLVVVDHTVSEEPGILGLVEYLQRTFPDVRVEYIPTHCPFRLIQP